MDGRRRATVAYGLVLIIDNEERFRVLGLSESKSRGSRARSAVRVIVDSLET